MHLRSGMVFILLLLPYLAARRVFALLFGISRRNVIFNSVGLGSTWDYLAKLMMPVGLIPWIVVATRFGYESEVARNVLKIRGRLFIDVGANIGYYSVLASRNFEQVLAFEPNPLNLVRLRDTVRIGKIRNILISGMAVSDSDGQAMFYFDERESHPMAGGGSLEAASVEKGAIVQTVKFDTLLKGNVDLVKVDVEGAEWKVLKGAEQSIRTGRIRRMIIELHDDEPRKRELEDYLRQRFSFTRWLDARHIMAVL